MARSASRRISSGSPSLAEESAMPMDAVTKTSRPSKRYGLPRDSSTRTATASAVSASADLDEQLVAHGVAERIVDDLEAVEIEEEHGQMLVAPLGAREAV